MPIKHFIKGLTVCYFVCAVTVAAFAQSSLHNIAVCQLTAGHPVFCSKPFTGKAVMPLPLGSGAYYTCSITAGNITFCAAPYTGRTVIQQLNGVYASCLIELGQVKFCNLPYTGRAVIPAW